MASGSSYVEVFGGNAVRPAQPSFEALTIAANTALYWPLEVTEGVPLVAAQINVTATTTNLQLQMPPGNTGSVGVQTIISNVGSNTFTVTDQAGNQIAQIATTQAWIIALEDNSTANGTWSALQLASTTSSAVASALAGAGLQANGSQLQTIWNTASLSANTAITPTYRSTLIVWTGAGGTLQLNASATLTPGWFCAVTNEGSGAVTLSTTGGETINGGGSITIQPGNSGIVICEAGAFNTVGALITTLSIEQGGTGASTAAAALANLGGTAIGQSIFTAPTASSVIALLGLNNYTFTEASISTGQTLAAGSTNTVFVCTAALIMTLPLTTTLTQKFVVIVFAQGGAVTLTPQSSDAIEGGSAGANFVVPMGTTVMLVTDINGNWWLPFLPSAPIPPPGVQFGDMKHSALGIEGGGWRLCYGQTRPQTDPFWQYMIANSLTGSWVPGYTGSTTYNMPDARGRGLFGQDDQGGTSANRITDGVSGIVGTSLLAAGGSQLAQEDTLSATSTATSSATSTVTDPGHDHTLTAALNSSGTNNLDAANSANVNNTAITTSTATTGITVATAVTTGVTTTVTSALTGASQNMPPAMIAAILLYVGA
jgi:hypothetical protein